MLRYQFIWRSQTLCYMSESSDIAGYSAGHTEIYVTNQASSLNEDGLELAVIRDVHDFVPGLTKKQDDAATTTPYKRIECTLILPPRVLKEWATLLKNGVELYENKYGEIRSFQKSMTIGS